jgi:hypothetical protein
VGDPGDAGLHRRHAELREAVEDALEDPMHEYHGAGRCRGTSAINPFAIDRDEHTRSPKSALQFYYGKNHMRDN